MMGPDAGYFIKWLFSGTCSIPLVARASQTSLAVRWLDPQIPCAEKPWSLVRCIGLNGADMQRMTRKYPLVN